MITRARKSIATFKVREGMALGAKVTLRGDRMYEFLDRLVTIALPRVQDFRGLNPKSFDGRGNFALGLKEHIVFPEIDYDKVDEIWGMDVIVCTTAKTDDEARELLRASTSRSGSERSSVRYAETWRTDGEDELRREEQPPQAAGDAVRRPSARRAEGDRRTDEAADGGALRRAPEARRAAAQFGSERASAIAAR